MKRFLSGIARYISKSKLFFVINILGLSLSVSAALIIGLWIKDEISVDKGYIANKNLYKLLINYKMPDGSTATRQNSFYPAKQLMDAELPELKESLILNEEEVIVSSEKRFFSAKGYYSSANFFNFFHFPLLLGNPDNTLENISSTVITERLAKKIFGENWKEKNIIGETLQLDVDTLTPLQVAGVCVDPPKNSTIDFDMLLSIDLNFRLYPWNMDMGNHNHQIYAMLNSGADKTKAENTINNIIKELSNGADNAPEFWFYPFERLYLHGNIDGGKVQGGRIEYVRIFGVVAIVILILSCINYMNLSTATSFYRIKEIGIKKTLGASTPRIMFEYLKEALFFATSAVILAMLIVFILLPSLNSLTNKSIQIAYFSPQIWLFFILLILITAIGSSLYPSYLLSSGKTPAMLKGEASKSGFNATFSKKAFIVLQFTICCIMFSSAYIFWKQMEFLEEKNIGLQKKSVISYYPKGQNKAKHELIKQLMLEDQQVTAATGANQSPISVNNTNSGFSWEGMAQHEPVELHHIGVSHDFAKTFNIPMASGRDFSRNFSDSLNFVINESAAIAMDLKDPIGKRLEAFGKTGVIIGVYKDFNNQLLYSPIKPMIAYLAEPEVLYFKVEDGRIASTIEKLAQVHNKVSLGEYPLEYSIFDEEVNQSYSSERSSGKLINYFSVLAFVISIMGLIGLIALSTKKRSKEIVMRKILGSTNMSVVRLLVTEYFKIICISIVIAIPTVYIIVGKWLGAFQYTAEITFVEYLLPAIILTFFAIVTIALQSYNLVRKQLVNNLKDN